ncbi:hypothetical protein Ndes2526A_g01232 [Nannochloris sp. 'desiccata']|nr:hypothetical protein KSW81_004407 [Chlorella desiccata (nom. nud.)]
MPMRIPFLGGVITSSFSRLSLSRRAFLPRSTAAVDDSVALNFTHIDEFIKSRGVITLPREHGAAAGATEILEDACPLKCLLFLASGTSILIVLRLEDRVSEQALAVFLNVAKSRIEMAKTHQLVPLTGFPVGEVPPFGHREPLYTLVDQCVTSHSHVAFGNNLEYVLPTTELLRATNGKVVSVSVAAAAAAAAAAGQQGTGEEVTEVIRVGSGPSLPLPWVSGAQAVSLTGIIAQKRKIANLLLFLNIVPPSPSPVGKPATSAYVRRVWTHPDTSEPCEVQLILGKTLERRLGRSPATELFKSLKIGQIVKVTGKPQPHIQPKQGSAGQQQQQQSSSARSHVIDMVVHDIEITGSVAPSLYPPGLVDNEEEEDEMLDENEEAERERLRKEKKSKPFGAAEQALLGAELPFYKLPAPPENVKLVHDLQGIEYMAEILLSHQNSNDKSTEGQAAEAEGVHRKEKEDNDSAERSIPADATPATTVSTSIPVFSTKSRVKAARRQAALDPGTWRPKLILGLDAEWQPNFSREERNSPVSVLQIGSTTHVFLIDMLELCHNPRKDSLSSVGAPTPIPLTIEQKALSDVLEAILGDADIIKVGFGLKYDFKRLVESYPWMPCFGGGAEEYSGKEEKGEAGEASNDDTYNEERDSIEDTRVSKNNTPPPIRSVPIRSHVDALLLARSAGDGQTSYKRLGLSAVCRLILGKAVDKSEQTSDWGSRPLTQDQIYYAAADVTCLVDIYNKIIATRPDFLAAFWMAQFSGHLTDLAALRPKTFYSRRRGRGGDEGAGGASGAALPWRANVTARGYGSTNQVQCNTAALMRYLGQPIPDGGKLSIIRLAASETVTTGNGDDGEAPATVLVEPSRVPRFPRGSGVLEFSNRTYMLFVNVPSQQYPNVFSIVDSSTDEVGLGVDKKECFMTWWPGKGQTMAHPLIQRLLPVAAKDAKSKFLKPSTTTKHVEESVVPVSNDEDNANVEGSEKEEEEEAVLSLPTVLLFVRPQRDDYACFGRLEASTVEELDGQLCVSWKLVDYNEIEASAPFQQVLKLQK